ncbi:MAG: hypothetical protein ACYCST_11195 [Acidimicrobiales bacterium]
MTDPRCRDSRALIAEVERREHPSSVTEASSLERDLAAALKEVGDHRDRRAHVLSAACSDENGSCIVCHCLDGAHPDNHLEDCWVGRSLPGRRSGLTEVRRGGPIAPLAVGSAVASGLNGKSRLARLRAFFSPDLAPFSAPDLPWALSVSARLPYSCLHAPLADPDGSGPDGCISPAPGEYRP